MKTILIQIFTIALLVSCGAKIKNSSKKTQGTTGDTQAVSCDTASACNIKMLGYNDEQARGTTFEFETKNLKQRFNIKACDANGGCSEQADIIDCTSGACSSVLMGAIITVTTLADNKSKIRADYSNILEGFPASSVEVK